MLSPSALDIASFHAVSHKASRLRFHAVDEPEVQLVHQRGFLEGSLGVLLKPRSHLTNLARQRAAGEVGHRSPELVPRLTFFAGNVVSAASPCMLPLPKREDLPQTTGAGTFSCPHTKRMSGMRAVLDPSLNRINEVDR